MARESSLSAVLDQLTAIVKTFERPQCLHEFVSSVRRFYPRLPLFVADDSREPLSLGDDPAVEIVPLPFDVGLSVGRNRLLERIETPFFLLADDDLLFTAATRLETLLDVLTRHELDIVAGTKSVRGERLPFEGLLDLDASQRILYRRHGCYHEASSDHVRCDFVHNFFVARTERIRSFGGWDADLKLGEHTEFFLRLKALGARVAFVPEVAVEERQFRNAHYTRYRRRAKDFKRDFFLPKYGLQEMVDEK